MNTGRLEAFSDGVLAIVITIMVLEFKVPEGADWAALGKVLPTAMSYLLSFVYIGIYWNNHHHLFQATERVTGSVLWANLHLLFWLSLVPFTTGWMGHSNFAAAPVALYAADLLLAGFAYWILQGRILAAHGPDSAFAKAIGADLKGKASLVLYLASIPLAYVHAAASGAIFILVALMWLVPDRRLEQAWSNACAEAGRA